MKPELTYQGNPDYSLPVPESQEKDNEIESREQWTLTP